MMHRNLKAHFSLLFCTLLFLNGMLAQSEDFKGESVLNNGQIIKIGVANNGIFQIDAAFLSQYVEGFTPQNVSIWGNRGGMLPELNSAPRIDDLEQIPTYFVGNEDASFDSDERLLFYAEGPERIIYSASENAFDKPINVYEDLNYYFIVVGDNERQALNSKDYPFSGTAPVANTYIDYQRYEVDEINLLGDFISTLGSGKRWFGDIYSNLRTQSVTDQFDFSNTIPGSELRFEVEMAVRSNRSSNVELSVNGARKSRGLGSISPTITESTYARIARITNTITAPENGPLSNDDFQVDLSVSGNGDVFEAWLDYIHVEMEKPLQWDGVPLFFCQKPVLTTLGFEIVHNGEQIEVWNVTDPHETHKIEAGQMDASRMYFDVSADSLLKFMVFDPAVPYETPAFIETIDNQNLHGIFEVEYVIIYPEAFESAAERLADHRRNHSGFNVLTIPVHEIYNEFAGGSADVTAIRDFARMLYERSASFNYLCILGDGSYDYRDIVPDLPRTNMVHVYETNNSLHPIESFPSDDYFALLDPDEGDDLKGALEIAVGRLPVITANEAENIVDKIIRYETEDDAFGDWMLRVGFAADDEDDNQHLNQTIRLSDDIAEKYPIYNQEKIYFDAYPQVSTIGDARFPAAKKAINDNVFRGVLVMNYFGHGGPRGWAQERVLERGDINNWTNFYKLPLFVTATCSFTGYDDPAIRSGGELAFVNPNGGAIALFTTVRAVYSTDNERLTREIFDRIFEIDENGHLPLGEIMRQAKNSNRSDTIRTNARKFALIGDPGLKLALPQYKVITTEINGIQVNEQYADTLRALDRAIVKGQITDLNDNAVSAFNGEITITVFDKKKTLKTLGQDDRSYERSFEVQNNLIYKGKAEVVNGQFEVQFTVPKDIDYNFGFGRISYYAKSDLLESAAGYFDRITVGGTSEDGLADDTPPVIQLYMNNESFTPGGKTGPNPLLLAFLSDDNGINFTGNSIGHDLTAILDEDTRNAFILNEYYEADPNDFSQGIVRYPLSNLTPGKHSITFRAWDVANNMSEAQIDFEVVANNKAVFLNTFSFPNPFIDRTRIGFEHNLSGKNLFIRVRIFDIHGRFVRTIEQNRNAASSRIDDIEWDGFDDGGRPLPRGMYFYDIYIEHISDAGEKISGYSNGGRLTMMR